MNEDYKKQFISDWSAYVCAISSGAQATWWKFFDDIPDTEYNIITDAIHNIAERKANGYFKQNPNLMNLQAEYRHLKSQSTGNTTQLPDCGICNNSGLLTMCIALDLKKGRQVPLPVDVAVISPKADLLLTPCTCDRGKMQRTVFIKKGSHKSDEDRHYTEDQVIKLATKCGYSKKIEAERTRQKCERLYFAWLEKYPGKAVDQSIGYKGSDNKQVIGFQQKTENYYTPGE